MEGAIPAGNLVKIPITKSWEHDNGGAPDMCDRSCTIVIYLLHHSRRVSDPRSDFAPVPCDYV
jgi:hypothetical protein